MTTPDHRSDHRRAPELLGQTVVVIGGSAGIGLETARRARAEGADVIAHRPQPRTGSPRPRASVGALSTARLRRRPTPTGSSGSSPSCPGRSTTCWSPAGGPYYAPLADIDFDEARRDVDAHLWLPLRIARHAGRPGAAGRHAAVHGRHRRPPARASGSPCIGALTAALPALAANLALELAPIRVNLIAAGLRRHAALGALLGDDLEARRAAAARDAADRAGRRAGRRRRARRAPDGQHRADRRDLRHRRRPAADRGLSSGLGVLSARCLQRALSGSSRDRRRSSSLS